MNSQFPVTFVSFFVAAITSCASPPKPPAPTVVASPVASARRPDPCETAKALRARVPSLAQQGRLNRTLRVIRRADELCPSQRAESAAVLSATVAVLENAQDGGPALIAMGLEARKLGKISEAQRLFDRGIAQIEKLTQTKATIGMPDGFRDEIGAVAWSNDERIALAAGGHIQVLAASTLQERLRLESDKKSVDKLVFSADGRQLYDGSRVWDLAEGRLADGPFSATRLDGAREVSITESAVRVTDRASGRQVAKLVVPKDDEVHTTAFSADGKKIATVGARVVRLWDLESGKAVGKLERTDRFFCNFNGAVFSPDGKRIALIESERHGGSGTAPCWAVGAVWDLSTGKRISSVQSNSGPTNIEAVAFSPDGSKLVTASVTNVSFAASAGNRSVLDIWNVESGEALAKLSSKTMLIDFVVFSPDGGTLALTQANAEDSSLSRVVLWRLAPGKGIESLLGIGPISFSPDGTKLVCSLRNGATQILVDVATKRELARLRGIPKVFPPSAGTAPCQAELEPADDKINGRDISHGVVLRTPSGSQLAVLRLVGTDAGYVLTPDGFVELVGEASRRAVVCRVGQFSFSIEVCEERFVVPGLLAKVVSGDRSYGDP